MGVGRAGRPDFHHQSKGSVLRYLCIILQKRQKKYRGRHLLYEGITPGEMCRLVWTYDRRKAAERFKAEP